jgi:hypothetical protein
MRTIDAVEAVADAPDALALLLVQGEQGLEPGGLGGRVAPGRGRRESVLGGLSAASLLRTPPPGATRPPLSGVGADSALGGVVLDRGTNIRLERGPVLIGNGSETGGTNPPKTPILEGLGRSTGASIIVGPALGVLRNGFALAVAAALALALVGAVLVQADRSFANPEAVL